MEIIQKKEDAPSIIRSLHKLICREIEESSWTKVRKVIMKVVKLIGGILFVTFFKQITRSMVYLLGFSDGLPSALILVWIAYHFRSYLRHGLAVIIQTLKKEEGIDPEEYIGNFNKQALLTYLLQNRSFKREDVLTDPRFKEVSKQEFITMAERLETIGILTRGGDNARVLSENITASGLNEILRGINVVEEMTSYGRQNQSLVPITSPESMFHIRSVYGQPQQ